MRQVVFDEEETKGRSKQILLQNSLNMPMTASPLGVFVSADVFGAIIGSEEDAGAVGQIYGEMAQSLDYICPMIYPSITATEISGLITRICIPMRQYSGHCRNRKRSFPLIRRRSARRWSVPGSRISRPLYLEAIILNMEMTRFVEQIQAVYDAGYEEWILWNASNNYHYGGLEQ